MCRHRLEMPSRTAGKPVPDPKNLHKQMSFDRATAPTLCWRRSGSESRGQNRLIDEVRACTTECAHWKTRIGNVIQLAAHPCTRLPAPVTNGVEFYQLHRFDLATGDITLLTEGKSRNESPLWSHSGDSRSS